MDIVQIGNVARVEQAGAAGAVTTGTVKLARDTSPAITTSAVQEPETAVAHVPLEDILQSINKQLQSLSAGLEFSVDEYSNRTIVKVIDRQTGDIIRQMPSAEAIEISRALDKLQGVLVSLKA